MQKGFNMQKKFLGTLMIAVILAAGMQFGTAAAAGRTVATAKVVAQPLQTLAMKGEKKMQVTTAWD